MESLCNTKQKNHDHDMLSEIYEEFDISKKKL